MTSDATMRAARLHRPRTPEAEEDVRVDEIPVPEPGPGQVLVEIKACGVCASDLHVVQGHTPHGPVLPQTLGHEPAGVVADVGDGVDSWLAGDRVTMQMARSCGRCGYCLAGREMLCPDVRIPGVDVDGYQSEYALADARLLTPLPGSIPFEQAAILTDAVATPYHALKRGGVGEGVSVAVFGVGGLGLHAVQLAKLAGAETVIAIDLDPVNLDRAQLLGADEIVDASVGKVGRTVKEMTGGGVDRTFEFVGDVGVVDQALKCLKPGGRATIVGLTPDELQLMPEALFVAQELELVGSFGSTRADLEELIDLVDAGRLDLSQSISHRFPIDRFPEALKLLESRDDHPSRIVIGYE